MTVKRGGVIRFNTDSMITDSGPGGILFLRTLWQVWWPDRDIKLWRLPVVTNGTVSVTNSDRGAMAWYGELLVAEQTGTFEINENPYRPFHFE